MINNSSYTMWCSSYSGLKVDNRQFVPTGPVSKINAFARGDSFRTLRWNCFFQDKNIRTIRRHSNLCFIDRLCNTRVRWTNGQTDRSTVHRKNIALHALVCYSTSLVRITIMITCVITWFSYYLVIPLSVTLRPWIITTLARNSIWWVYAPYAPHLLYKINYE